MCWCQAQREIAIQTTLKNSINCIFSLTRLSSSRALSQEGKLCNKCILKAPLISTETQHQTVDMILHLLWLLLKISTWITLSISLMEEVTRAKGYLRLILWLKRTKEWRTTEISLLTRSFLLNYWIRIQPPNSLCNMDIIKPNST